jgi:hypothetical protein
MSKLTKLEKLWASGNRLRGTLNDPLRALTRLVDVQVTAPSPYSNPAFLIHYIKMNYLTCTTSI